MTSHLECSPSIKLAGFKSKAQLAKLAGVSVKTIYNDFSDRKFKPNIYNHLRRAMDKKQMIERATMEAAIKEMQNNKL